MSTKRNIPVLKNWMHKAGVAALLSTTAVMTCMASVASAQSTQPGTQLDTVVVIGKNENNTGVSLATKDAAVVVTGAELDQVGPADLQDVFGLQTAVSVGNSTPTSQKIFLHGIEELHLNVQIDGARQSNNLFHHNGGTLIDPSLLKAVEVNTGVAPADAGPHALAGAIRFETVDVDDLLAPGEKMGGTIGVSYDSNSETFTASGSVYARSSGFEALLAGSFADGDDYTNGAGEVEPWTAASLKSGLAKLAYQSTGGDRLEVSTEYVEDAGIRPHRANFTDVLGRNNDPLYTKLSRHTTTLSYETKKPTKNYDPTVKLYFNEARLFRDTSFDAKVESLGGKVENNFKTSSGKITVGADFYNDAASNEILDPAHLSYGGTFKEKATNIGIYAQARVTAIDGIRFSFGARGDYQQFEGVDGSEFDNFGFSPNGTVEIDANKNLTFFGGVSRTFGGIKLTEIALISGETAGRGGNYTPGYDQNINPEWATNYKFGARYNKGGWSAEGYYFDTKIEDVNYQYASAARGNIGELESKGVDLSAKYSWSNAYLGFKYSHIDVTLNDAPLSPNDFYLGTPIGDIFKLYGAYQWQNIGLTVGFAATMTLDLKETSAPAGELEGATVVNAFAEWKPKQVEGLTLRAEVNNVFDEQYTDRATNGVGYTGPGPIIDPLHEPGRSVKIGGKLKF